MNIIKGVEIVKQKLSAANDSVKIPLMRGNRTFTAQVTEGGIMVDNLGTQPFLPWEVFHEAICVLIRSGGTAKRGDAMKYKLGDPELAFDSIEGHVAQVVYGKKQCDTIFRRITPIVCVLVWAGLCSSNKGKVTLL